MESSCCGVCDAYSASRPWNQRCYLHTMCDNSSTNYGDNMHNSMLYCLCPGLLWQIQKCWPKHFWLYWWSRICFRESKCVKLLGITVRLLMDWVKCNPLPLEWESYVCHSFHILCYISFVRCEVSVQMYIWAWYHPGVPCRVMSQNSDHVKTTCTDCVFKW